MAATDFLYGRNPLPSGGDVPVKNLTGSTIVAGSLVKLDTGNPLGATQNAICVTPTVATSDHPFGVAVENIPTGQQGRVQVEGIVQCIALGAIAVGAIVGPCATAGQVNTYPGALPQLGQALSAAANAADPILVKIEIAENH